MVSILRQRIICAAEIVKTLTHEANARPSISHKFMIDRSFGFSDHTMKRLF